MTKLEDLLVDSNEIEEELLAALLLPYAGIERATGEAVFKEPWYELNISQKVLVYLMARKASVVLGLIENECEPQAPSEIEACTGIKGNSVRPTLTKLKADKLIEQSSEGYFVPGVRLRRIATEVFGNE